jgi:hypothetical protein
MLPRRRQTQRMAHIFSGQTQIRTPVYSTVLPHEKDHALLVLLSRAKPVPQTNPAAPSTTIVSAGCCARPLQSTHANVLMVVNSRIGCVPFTILLHSCLQSSLVSAAVGPGVVVFHRTLKLHVALKSTSRSLGMYWKVGCGRGVPRCQELVPCFIEKP